MPHFERTDACPEGEVKVSVGNTDVEVPESGKFPVNRAVAQDFATHAAATGFYVQVDDDETDEDARAREAADAAAQVAPLPAGDAAVVDSPVDQPAETVDSTLPDWGDDN